MPTRMRMADPLTGLGDDAAFRETLAAARRRYEVAVLLVEVTDLAAINAVSGRQAGDRALLGLAAALSSALRTGDELFRVGGDDFAAIVAVTEAAEADHAAQRLRAAAPGVRVSVGAGRAS